MSTVDIPTIRARLAAWYAAADDGSPWQPFRIHPTDLAALCDEVERLRTALKKIVRGEGAFDRDPFVHANNTIVEAVQTARAALTPTTVDGR